MRGLVDDVRYAVRALRRAPGFSSLAIATLAAGVGLTVAMFSVVYGVLFRPLPFTAPDRVVQVFRTGPDGRGGNVAAPVGATVCASRVGCAESGALHAVSAKKSANAMFARSWSLFIILGPAG
jgi:hypothetical protein